MDDLERIIRGFHSLPEEDRVDYHLSAIENKLSIEDLLLRNAFEDVALRSADPSFPKSSPKKG